MSYKTQSNRKKRKRRHQSSRAPRVYHIPIDVQRSCGGCKACCNTMAVQDEDFDKPMYTDCSHMCESGCDIYDTRPKSCKHFVCLWLGGLGKEEARPDKCGYLLYVQSDSMFGEILVANSTRPDAFDDKDVKADLMARAIEYDKLIYLYRPNNEGSSMIGPPELMAKATALLNNKDIAHEKTFIMGGPQDNA